MSNAIASIKFTGNTKGEMFVTFTSGVEVCYEGVSREDYKDFASAKSLGGHFNKHIRPKYTAVR